MAHEDRDNLRMVYQREEASASKFIPAKPKIDISNTLSGAFRWRISRRKRSSIWPVIR